jgi:hypothetical protein
MLTRVTDLLKHLATSGIMIQVFKMLVWHTIQAYTMVSFCEQRRIYSFKRGRTLKGCSERGK